MTLLRKQVQRLPVARHEEMKNTFLFSRLFLGLAILPWTMLLKLVGYTLETHTLPTLCAIITFVSVAHILNSSFFQPMIDWSHDTQPLRRIQSGLFAMLIGVCIFHIVAVLFGAPLIDSFFGTLLWATLMSSLCVLPAGLIVGSDFAAWKYLFLSSSTSHTLSEMGCYWSALGAAIGAWFGALPIPLDWDRPWQVWPISCTYGALLGYMLGMGWTIIHGYTSHQLELR